MRFSPGCTPLDQEKSSCTEVYSIPTSPSNKDQENFSFGEVSSAGYLKTRWGHLVLAWALKMKLLKWHSCTVPYHVDSGKPVGPMLLEFIFFFPISYARFNMKVGEKNYPAYLVSELLKTVTD